MVNPTKIKPPKQNEVLRKLLKLHKKRELQKLKKRKETEMSFYLPVHDSLHNKNTLSTDLMTDDVVHDQHMSRFIIVFSILF